MAEYTITKDDFLSASWYLQRKHRLVVAIRAVLVGTLCGLYLGSRGMGMGGAVMAGVAVVVLGMTLRELLQRRRVARIYNDHLAASPQVSLTVTDEGIELKRAVASVQMAWEQIKFWGENERFLFLYQGKDFAHIVLKEALSADEDRMIRERLTGVKRI